MILFTNVKLTSVLSVGYLLFLVCLIIFCWKWHSFQNTSKLMCLNQTLALATDFFFSKWCRRFIKNSGLFVRRTQTFAQCSSDHPIMFAPVAQILFKGSVGRYGPVMTDSSRLQQHHTISDDPGQGCKAHGGGIRP